MRLRSDSRSTALVVLIWTVTIAGGCSSGPSPSDHYQKGLQAEQRGDWDAARNEFDAAKTYQDAARRSAQDQQNAASVATAYDRGTTALNGQQWQEAFSQFDTVLKLSPSYKDAQAKRIKAIQQLDAIIGDAGKKAATGDLQGAATTYKGAGTYQGADKKASDFRAAADAYDAAQKAIGLQQWWDAYVQLAIVTKLDPGFQGAQQQQQTAQQKLDGFLSDGDAKLAAGDLKGASDAYAGAGNYKQANQKASSLQSKIATLDQLYGQMDASAKAGDWTQALEASAAILADVPAYRDVKLKRAGYIDQLYAAAGTAAGKSDWKEAIRL